MSYGIARVLSAVSLSANDAGDKPVALFSDGALIAVFTASNGHLASRVGELLDRHGWIDVPDTAADLDGGHRG